jgi:4-diphosphocytidyl-2-C-methyl-D-erythritol kinase
MRSGCRYLLGLAAGSGNAAAVLRLCNEQLGGVLSQEELLKLAAELGSDVPQALAGGATLISGSGEVVHPVSGR